MENFITRLKGPIQGVFKKLHEVKLLAIGQGNLLIRVNGSATVTVLSGTVTYNGTPITTMDVPLNVDVTLVMTAGAKISVIGKENLVKLQSTICELTDGYTLDDLHYSPITHLRLSGKTSGSINSLDASKIVNLFLDDTQVDGSIDIFSESSVLTAIQVRNTNVGGHLSSLVGKSLASSSHFLNTNIFVDVEDIARMSTGNNAPTKYAGCYLYGDVSKMAPDVYVLSAQPESKIMPFSWKTQRHTNPNAFIISNYSTRRVAFINYGNDLDAMLLDQAQCAVAAADPNKVICAWGNHTANSGWENAVTTLINKGYRVFINDTEILA